jgi:putative transposase
VPKKTRKKRALGNGSNACHRHRAIHANHVWSWDFIFDRTESGQTLKWFVIIDEFTRRCITLDVSRGFKSTDIINRLSELFVMFGMPEHIRSVSVQGRFGGIRVVGLTAVGLAFERLS